MRLHRDANTGHGDVSILGYLADDPAQKSCRVWVNLAEDDYADAVLAHDLGLTVSVLGDLRRNGNRSRLVNARSFRSWNEPD